MSTKQATRKPGRPREDHVPTEPGKCLEHGAVEFRLHRAGLRPDGEQKYVRRCPACHNDKNKEYTR